jgi:hypothetical protein
MKNSEIVKAAISKAHFTPEELHGISFEWIDCEATDFRVTWSLQLTPDIKKPLMESSVQGIIFCHDFAKAFWGEQDQWSTTQCTCGGVDFHIAGHDAHKPECAKVSSPRGYLFHLKELAITPPDERLKHIERFL